MRITTIILLFQLFVIGAHAQFQKTPLFHDSDVITLQFIPNDGYFYNHKIEKGNTIYSLSRTFNVTVASILTLNNLDMDVPVEVGQNVKIPVNPIIIYQGNDITSLPGKYIPVHYTVKPKETLFRIAKMYFNQSVEDLRKKNNLSSNNLEIGQQLLVGWIPVDGTTLPSSVVKTIIDEQEHEKVVTSTDTPLTSTTEQHATLEKVITHNQNFPVVESEIETEEIATQVVAAPDSSVVQKMPDDGRKLLMGTKDGSKMTMTSRNMVAHWDKNIPDNGVAYALHNEAVPNTYIELYNPNLKRSIRAKVIGKIPFGSYTSDVQLVISPRAARLLGGLDQRFRVEAKYLK